MAPTDLAATLGGAPETRLHRAVPGFLTHGDCELIGKICYTATANDIEPRPLHAGFFIQSTNTSLQVVPCLLTPATYKAHVGTHRQKQEPVLLFGEAPTVSAEGVMGPQGTTRCSVYWEGNLKDRGWRQCSAGQHSTAGLGLLSLKQDWSLYSCFPRPSKWGPP